VRPDTLRQHGKGRRHALSFAAERHRTYVSLLERGRNSPSMRTLWLMADALGVKPSEILRRVEVITEWPARDAAPRKRR
jgi:transcriptional regulator with XRE-family HTH domain